VGVITKFHKGAWWIFVNYRGRRKAKRVGDRASALEVARQIREAIACGAFYLPAGPEPEPEAPPPPPESLQAYALTWLAGAAIKSSTRRFYGDNLRNYVYPVLGTVPIGDLRRSHVKDLILAARAKGLGTSSVVGIVRTLSTVLSEAVEDEKLVANPALRPGRLRRRMSDPNELRKQPVDPYTREEVCALLETAKVHFAGWYHFLLCAVRTGLRLGELRALEWDAVDWRGRFLDVRRNYVEGVFTTPKNHEQRHVDLSMQLRAEFRVRRRQQRARWWQVGRPLPALVFPSDVETPLDDARIRKAMIDIARKAEVRVRRSPVHVLRHTFASLLIQNGESLVYVKEQLGHSSIQITVDIYGHLIPGGNRAAVDRLDTDADATQTQPRVLDLVSRVGIEPTTRRLREGTKLKNR
jgi:integrase